MSDRCRAGKVLPGGIACARRDSGKAESGSYLSLQGSDEQSVEDLAGLV